MKTPWWIPWILAGGIGICLVVSAFAEPVWTRHPTVHHPVKHHKTPLVDDDGIGTG